MDYECGNRKYGVVVESHAKMLMSFGTAFPGIHLKGIVAAQELAVHDCVLTNYVVYQH